MMDIDTAGKHAQNVLVVVAHTDDETFGMGGTIARHVAAGDRVYALSMTDGVGSRDVQSAAEVEARAQAARGAAEILGMKWLEGGSFPDNAMDTVSLLAVAKLVEDAKRMVRPSLVYTHSAADLNIDHRILCQATLTAFRPQPNETWQEIRTFEVPSATDYGHRSVTASFHPNLYIDIADVWDRKLAAAQQYHTELRSPPHSRSPEGLDNLSRLRGNQAGLQRAEAFEILRKILR